MVTIYSMRVSIRLTICILVLGLVLGSSVLAKEKLVFSDMTWESSHVHNRIAGFIAEHGFGYEVEYLFVDTVPSIQGMQRGDIDINMEGWIDAVKEVYEEAFADGSTISLGSNFPDAPQGWYVPTYVIEGDPERGIEPVAPDLKTVDDLAKYWKLFTHPENPRKGRFYNGPTGWAGMEISDIKLESYGLSDYYEGFYTGSQSALDTSILRAYERGEPWFGYYWEPTALMGSLDMTMIEEPAYTDECWEEDPGDYACAFPSTEIQILVHKSVPERMPELTQILKNYETGLNHTNAFLAYMFEEDVDAFAAAEWFLREYEELWTSWIDDENVINKVKAAL